MIGIPYPVTEVFVLEIAYVFWCAFFFPLKCYAECFFPQYILTYLLLIDILIFYEIDVWLR